MRFFHPVSYILSIQRTEADFYGFEPEVSFAINLSTFKKFFKHQKLLCREVMNGNSRIE